MNGSIYVVETKYLMVAALKYFSNLICRVLNGKIFRSPTINQKVELLTNLVLQKAAVSATLGEPPAWKLAADRLFQRCCLRIEFHTRRPTGRQQLCDEIWLYLYCQAVGGGKNKELFIFRGEIILRSHCLPSQSSLVALDWLEKENSLPPKSRITNIITS